MDKLLTTLIRYLTGPAVSDAFMGDLVEHRRTRGSGWFWRAAVGMLLAATMQRFDQTVRGSLDALRAMSSEPIGELGQATRALRRRPIYTASLVAVMALGFAVALAVFATVDGLLFRPLPYERADQLYAVHATSGTATRFAFSAAEIAQWRAAIPEVVFGGFSAGSESSLETLNEPGLGFAWVDLPLFDVLRVRPRLGGLEHEVTAAGTSDFPVLISDRLWTRFGRDPGILGRIVEIDPLRPIRYRVAGVLPGGFLFPSANTVQVVSLDNGRSSLQVLARIPDRTAPEIVRQRLEALMAASPRRANQPAPRTVLTPLALHLSGGQIERGERLPGEHVQTARTAFIAMSLLVLLACVNASALMAARVTDRTRDLVQRRAVGATTVEIARSVLAEMLIILFAGLVISVALAAVLLGVLETRLPESHALMTPELGVRTMVFAGVTLIACLVASSAWPVARAVRVDWSTLGRGRADLTMSVPAGRSTAIAIQVGLGVVLTICGLLAAGSVWQVGRNDPGFADIDHLGVIETRISAPLAPDRNLRLAAALNGFLDRIRRSAEVVAAGAADTWVLSGGVAGRMVMVNPIGAVADTKRWILPIPVTDGFFQATGLPLVAGRLPTNAELGPGGRFVVVSAAAAAAYWPGESPLQKELEINRRRNPVIGVVEDVRYRSWDQSIDPAIYVPWEAADGPRANPMIFVRTRTQSARVLEGIATGSMSASKGLRLRRALPASVLLADSIRERRLRSWAFGTFAAGALCVVGAGVFGLVAMSVGCRRREAGIRVALGATHLQVIRQLTNSQIAAVAVGLATGLLLSIGTARMMRTSLYNLSPFEPFIWTVAGLVVLVVGTLATIVPAHRAGRIDPAVVLRE
jgi:predicted permease